MLKLISYCLLSLIFINLSSYGGNPLLPETLQNKEKPKICFTENKGQVHDQFYKPRPDVLYGAMASNMAVHIKNNGVSYQLYRVDKYKEVEDQKTKEKRQEIDQQTIYRVDLSWLNANKNFTKSEDEALPGYNNYYLESCPNGALNVKSYKGVSLLNIYPGINLHYYEKNGELKHDYIVAPHADYKQIQVKVEGAEIFVKQDGSLFLTTPLGKIQEGAPIVYQNNKKLNAKWRIKNNILGFEIENYNPNYELIIDPVTRLWGTYYGGIGQDYGYGTSVDVAGNVYLAGYAESNSGIVIATTGAHQTTHGGSVYDAFIVKFNGNGIRQWGTYYGGSGVDYGGSCCADNLGNIYLSGTTASNLGSAISTFGSHQSAFGGGNTDAYIVKFDGNGIRQWGTYYGGSGEDESTSVKADANGNVYLAGYTTSNNGNSIATAGAHQTNYGGGTYDAFLVKFNSGGLRQWATYYGDSELEFGNEVTVDGSGHVILVGVTESYTGTAIATGNAHQTAYGGGSKDAFIVKFDGFGSRQWGSYYGGAGDDGGNGVCVDAAGNVYLTGYTASNTGTIIATNNSHQSVYGGGLLDAFLAKFNINGVRQWASYYGGQGRDNAVTACIDALGNVYVGGQTTTLTSSVIATSGAHQTIYGGGTFGDAFLVKLNAGGNRQWGTYYGGTIDDYGFSIETDLFGFVYLAGMTSSNAGTAIASAGAFQSTHGGGLRDAFLVKFGSCTSSLAQPGPILGTTLTCAGTIATIYSVTPVSGASFYLWLLPTGWIGSSTSNTISVTPNSTGSISVAAGDTCGTSPTQNLLVTILPQPNVSISSTHSILCTGESTTLSATGANSYTWNNGSNAIFIFETPTISTTYTLIGINSQGCINTSTFTQNVDACVGISENPNIHPSSIKVYPNPNNGLFNVESDTEAKVLVIDLQGRIIGNQSLVSGKNQISIEHLENGVYILEVSHSHGKEVFRIVKQ
ncbi:MAG: SBBP repeat-containing protein [Bacteroidia bacterium]|jgi:hypothetical protein|nr:SBBP repeat-containing protein [Bacteroidia bacterium]